MKYKKERTNSSYSVSITYHLLILRHLTADQGDLPLVIGNKLPGRYVEGFA